MSEELDRRLREWRTSDIGPMYKRCRAAPPVVQLEIMRGYISELEQALRDERKRCAKVVEANISCGCKPEFCECYGWSTLERIAAAIRTDDQQGGK